MNDLDRFGDQLRSTLQDISPLATDPVPAPRFLAAGAPTAAEVIDLDAAGGSSRRPRRRIAVAGAVLLAAAVTAGIAVLVTDVAGHTATPAASVHPTPSASSTPPPRPTTVPESAWQQPGVALGTSVWRCSAPAATTLQVISLRFAGATDERWVVFPGATCRPVGFDVTSIVVDPDGHVHARSPAPASWGGSATCFRAQSQPATHPVDMSMIPRSAFRNGTLGGFAFIAFTSRGAQDYVDFYGSGCRLVLPGS